jgi:hypothetical protein
MGMVEKHRVELLKNLGAVKLSVSAVPTTITNYGHGLSKRPSHVIITHTAYGTTGVVREIVASRNASVVALQASISGIGVDVLVLP